jgi:hypothetical protein
VSKGGKGVRNRFEAEGDLTPNRALQRTRPQVAFWSCNGYSGGRSAELGRQGGLGHRARGECGESAWGRRPGARSSLGTTRPASEREPLHGPSEACTSSPCRHPAHRRCRRLVAVCCARARGRCRWPVRGRIRARGRCRVAPPLFHAGGKSGREGLAAGRVTGCHWVVPDQCLPSFQGPWSKLDSPRRPAEVSDVATGHPNSKTLVEDDQWHPEMLTSATRRGGSGERPSVGTESWSSSWPRRSCSS